MALINDLMTFLQGLNNRTRRLYDKQEELVGLATVEDRPAAGLAWTRSPSQSLAK